MATACAASAGGMPYPLNPHRVPPTITQPPLTVRLSSRNTLYPAASFATFTDPSPVFKSVTAFAPATVANLGPGFDFLGCAVDTVGDLVTAAADPSVAPGAVSITSITTTPDAVAAARLSLEPTRNCAGIAALAVMRALDVRTTGVSLRLHKGLPLGSGLGSSAASAAAAAVAVNNLFGGLLDRNEIVSAGLESEAIVSGRHADNIAPAVLGGFVLVKGVDPLDLLPLHFPEGKNLIFVLVTPEFEAPTKAMRAALSPTVSMKDHVYNASQGAVLAAAVLMGDAKMIGAAMSADTIVEPKRAPKIPGMVEVKQAALDAGAFGCTISGAGPTAVAVVEDERKGEEIGEVMVATFMNSGKLRARATVARLDHAGARTIESE